MCALEIVVSLWRPSGEGKVKCKRLYARVGRHFIRAVLGFFPRGGLVCTVYGNMFPRQKGAQQLVL